MNRLAPFSITRRAIYDVIITHDGVEHAGYLAFLSILSVFPFLVFLVAAVGFVGQSQIGTEFVALILDNEIIPIDVRSALQPRIAEIVSGPPQGLLTISIVGAIWTASSAVEGIRTVLNRAYRVEDTPAYIWRRLMSIAQFLILTLVIILGMLGFIVIPNLWHRIEEYVPFIELFEESYWSYLRFGLMALVSYCVVTAFYVVIPNTTLRWWNASRGAIIVVILWMLFGQLLTAYLSNFNQVNLIYGSLGGIIAALLFFYVSALIFIFGAELNYHLEKARGRRIQAEYDN